ncbi:MAG: sigma-70 family RNA polymerase sigma factor [Candidatus Moraniibacteriota bacterium]|nr:MAG: sigma-70 family RNA polymerase sigma factor [Candidatus Moranbacteria bacterium]
MFDSQLCIGINDEDLVSRSLLNRDFFGCLVKRYEAPLLRYIHRITNVSSEEAHDLLQESFIKAYSNLNGFDVTLSFSSWMYRIVYHQVISAYRKKSIRPEGHLLDIDDEILGRIKTEENILKDIERKDISRLVQEAIESLDEKYREVIVLYYLEEKNYQEISDILEKPPGTIATLLNRAKKKLRELLYKKY